jgi:hypothetical protein
MTEATAQVLLYVITAAGFIVWLLGLQFLLTASRRRIAANRQAAEQLELSEPPEANWIVGSTEVEGQPAALAVKAAAVLAKESIAALGPLKIVQRTGDRVTFERINPSLAMQPSWRGGFRRGQLRLTPVGRERTRVDYAIEMAGGQWLLWLGGIFQALGLLALVVGFWVISTYVVPHPHPAVRWQTLQMMQVVHFLWPPFLCGGLYRVWGREVRAGFDALVNNLPYYGN